MFQFQDYYNADNIGFLILKFPISMTLYTWRNDTVKSNKGNDKKVTTYTEIVTIHMLK